MKRLFCIIGSLLVCTSSVFAWNANSFLADGSAEYQPYVSDELLEDPMGEPMMVSTFSMRATESGSASAEVHEVDWTQGSWSFYTDDRSDQLFSMFVNYGPIVIPPNVSIPSSPGLELKEVPIYKSESSTYHSWRTASTLFNPPGNTESVSYVQMANGHLVLPVNLDHIPANCNAFEFSLDLISCFVRGYYNGSVSETVYPSSLDVYLNGSKVKTYGFNNQGALDVTDEIVSVNSSIQDAYFVITIPSVTLYNDVSLTANNYYIWWSYFGLNSSISYSFLDLRDTIINDFHNQQAGDALDEHNALESEWSGSMMDNFNALDIGSFAFPGGLIAALALLTGIFNDLWNGMGEYKVLYVFPLTLGVVLLLIGRISKFSGQRSSARSGKGDDSA